jgi:hypothetical protein
MYRSDTSQKIRGSKHRVQTGVTRSVVGVSSDTSAEAPPAGPAGWNVALLRPFCRTLPRRDRIRSGRTLPCVLQRRAVIDYALARRATLVELQRGLVSRTEVCDAHPYLLRAAAHHGLPTTTRCPVCRSDRPLIHVTYAYGDELGESSGRAREQKELVALSLRCADVRVYVVEVCRGCSWNHLVTSYSIGTEDVGTGARRPRRRTAST